MRRIASVIPLLLAATSGAWAAKPLDLDAAIQPAHKALAAGDYAAAYSQYSGVAAKNPLAQFSLGLIHKNGWGRPVDEREACLWFEKAARENVPAAQHFLGDCLVKGIHSSASPPSAIDWYRKAAAGGHFISLCSAADFYIRGIGVDQDVDHGLALCTQAAQAGSPPAMLKLADYFRADRAVKHDLAAARYWYLQAAKRHSPVAQYRLGVMLSEGQGGAPDLGAARFWLETAASEGYAAAYLPTAILYANADPVAETGALAPEHLAKIYLWVSAAKARSRDPMELAEIARIGQLIAQVMPAAWRPALDQRVAEHLARFPATN